MSSPRIGTRRIVAAAGLLGVSAIAARCWVLPRVLPAGTIDYRGESIKLSKHYFDYESYKDDPDNIAPEERARAARLVRDAPMPHAFRSREDMIRATFDIRFPGYGLTQLGPSNDPDGGVIAGYAVEVPASGEDRVFVFRGVGESYTLIDDFIAASNLGILSVRKDGGDLVLSNYAQQDVLRRALSSH